MKGNDTYNNINRNKELMKEISKIISKYKINQNDVAKLLGIKQARVSNLLDYKKHYDKFSMSKLFEYLDLLGESVNFYSENNSNSKLRITIVNNIRKKREDNLLKLKK
ncbi:XRE family transcriptional regulator [Psychromonas aquatilis]|uniref:XRE family transcriptional regulator n=1 Tax=Psychromonas aquatilis TaxID=2005072 RepID=A0ABU9GRI2_9GAMM